MMKKRALIFCLLLCAIGTAENFDDYHSLLQRYSASLGPLGSWEAGEIEIVTDPETMQKMKKEMGRPVGIVAHDSYWMWINDVVRFPKGNYGIYARLLWKKSLDGHPGAGVLPISRDGKFVYLICIFRHATRSWELEIPRGCRENNESPEETAEREATEETGCLLSRITSLGELAHDTGTLVTVLPIFLAEVSGVQESQPEDSEAIAKVVRLPIQQVFQGLVRGEVDVPLAGMVVKAKVRDVCLSYALLQAHLRGYISIPNEGRNGFVVTDICF